MILLGFVLIAASVVVGTALISQNTDEITVTAFGSHWTAHAYGLVIAGIAVAFVCMLGLMLVRSATARGWRLRRDRRRLAAENELLAEQATVRSTPGATPTPNSGYVYPSP